MAGWLMFRLAFAVTGFRCDFAGSVGDEEVFDQHGGAIVPGAGAAVVDLGAQWAANTPISGIGGHFPVPIWRRRRIRSIAQRYSLEADNFVSASLGNLLYSLKRPWMATSVLISLRGYARCAVPESA